MPRKSAAQCTKRKFHHMTCVDDTIGHKDPRLDEAFQQDYLSINRLPVVDDGLYWPRRKSVPISQLSPSVPRQTSTCQYQKHMLDDGSPIEYVDHNYFTMRDIASMNRGALRPRPEKTEAERNLCTIATTNHVPHLESMPPISDLCMKATSKTFCSSIVCGELGGYCCPPFSPFSVSSPPNDKFRERWSVDRIMPAQQSLYWPHNLYAIHKRDCNTNPISARVSRYRLVPHSTWLPNTSGVVDFSQSAPNADSIPKTANCQMAISSEKLESGVSPKPATSSSETLESGSVSVEDLSALADFRDIFTFEEDRDGCDTK